MWRFTTKTATRGRASYSAAEFVDYATQNHSFESVIANQQEDVLYTSGEGTERFQGALISPNTFEFLDVKPLLGRVAQAADYEPGAPLTFILRRQNMGKPLQLRSFDLE